MKNKKKKRQKLDVFYDLYQGKFNYFDASKGVWVFGRIEEVSTPEGKDKHDLAAKTITDKYPQCEIVSVSYC